MKWMLVAIAVFALVGPVMAEEPTPLQARIQDRSMDMFKNDLTADPEGIEIRNGSFYDFEAGKWEYCAMKRVLGIGRDYYQFWISTGYATTGKIVGSISYDLTPLMAKVFGLPIYDIISLDVGGYGGYDLVTANVAYGLGSTIVKVNVGALAQTLGVSIF